MAQKLSIGRDRYNIYSENTAKFEALISAEVELFRGNSELGHSELKVVLIVALSTATGVETRGFYFLALNVSIVGVDVLSVRRHAGIEFLDQAVELIDRALAIAVDARLGEFDPDLFKADGFLRFGQRFFPMIEVGASFLEAALATQAGLELIWGEMIGRIALGERLAVMADGSYPAPEAKAASFREVHGDRGEGGAEKSAGNDAVEPPG